MDVVVTTDVTPRFDFFNKDGITGLAFAPVEGTLGAFSLKSDLTGPELHDALENLASIPPTKPLAGRINPALVTLEYEEWPLKVIYAPRGNKPMTLLGQINDFYQRNPQIPLHRRVSIVHVAGSCAIVRGLSDSLIRDHDTGEEWRAPHGAYQLMEVEPDIQAIAHVLNYLHSYAFVSAHINYHYFEIFNRVRRV